jgi:hypothetical protein
MARIFTFIFQLVISNRAIHGSKKQRKKHLLRILAIGGCLAHRGVPFKHLINKDNS